MYLSNRSANIGQISASIFQQQSHSLLFVTSTAANPCTEVSCEDPSLKINTSPPLIPRLRSPSKEDPLSPLPGLYTQEEQQRANEDNPPFPADPLVLEDSMVNNRDVKDWENSNETKHDTPEQELVPPDVEHPLCEVFLAPRLHAEETAAHVYHLPGKEEREPS